jgi:hypothetical protein
MLASLAAAAYYLPAHHLIFAIFIILALVGGMNSNFYVFLAGKRGLAFMLAAIPFHLLYHFYNGISFIVGSARHYWNAELEKGDLPVPAAKPIAPVTEFKPRVEADRVEADPRPSVKFKAR